MRRGKLLFLGRPGLIVVLFGGSFCFLEHFRRGERGAWRGGWTWGRQEGKEADGDPGTALILSSSEILIAYS